MEIFYAPKADNYEDKDEPHPLLILKVVLHSGDKGNINLYIGQISGKQYL